MSMKRKRLAVWFCMSLLLAYALVSPAVAAKGQYSIQEIHKNTQKSWVQTYQAYGRTISVNCPVEIPDVQKAPVLLVSLISPDQDAFNRMKALIAQEEQNDTYNNLYEITYQPANRVSVVTRKYPQDVGKLPKNQKSSVNELGISFECSRLQKFEMDQAYADHNPLTVNDACQTLLDVAQTLYPGTDYSLRYVGLTSRSKMKKSGQFLQEKGCYNIELVQRFAGLDFADTNPFVSEQPHEDAWFNEFFAARSGIATGEIYGKEEFFIRLRCYQTKAVLREDVPIVSFDRILPQVEKLIMDGKIRMIDKVQLGYIAYSSDIKEERVLVPSWIVWCIYTPNPASKVKQDIWGELGGYYSQSTSFIPLTFNACTGELLDPERTDAARLNPPKF